MPRGWQGNPPRSDDEARERIIDATMRCVDRFGIAKTGLSDVAVELGVTRQTVYRLFSSTDELLVAVALASTDAYLDRLAAHVSGMTDPAEAVCEGMAYTLERLPKERFIGPVLMRAHADEAIRGVTSDQAIAFGRSMLARMDVDWAAHGFGDVELDGLAEYGLRILQSLVLDPPRPARTKAQLRALLRQWVAPVVRAAADRAEADRLATG